MRRFLALLAVVLSMIGSMVPVAAAKKDEKLILQARQEAISTGMAKVWKDTHDEREVEKYLAKHGLEIVARPEQEISPLSNAADVTLPGPTVAYDKDINQYYMWFNFSWKSTDPLDSEGMWCQIPFTCNLGGPDMWAIHINDDTVLTLSYQQLVLYDNNGQITVVAENADFNSGNNGAAITHQDTIDTTSWPNETFNAYSGSMTVWMNPTGVHKSGVQIRSRMAHTWSSTSITGGSFSNGGLSLQFSSTAAKWDTQGQSVTYKNF